jgi:succinate dehydrogenase/fumarate reductase flavoprotein subunit
VITNHKSMGGLAVNTRNDMAEKSFVGREKWFIAVEEAADALGGGEGENR